MACDQMLVLCGPTYSTRLWCVWELFTLLSFSTLEHAQERITLAALTQETDDSDGLDGLVTFDVAKAHCYDPNEEARLRSVICASGEFTFNSRIKKLAESCRSAQERLGFMDRGMAVGFADASGFVRDIRDRLPKNRSTKVEKAETEIEALRERVTALEGLLSTNYDDIRTERERDRLRIAELYEQSERDRLRIRKLELSVDRLSCPT